MESPSHQPISHIYKYVIVQASKNNEIRENDHQVGTPSCSRQLDEWFGTMLWLKMPVLLTNREYVTYNLVFKRYIICTFSSLILFKIVYNDYLLTNPKNGLTIQIKERYYLFGAYSLLVSYRLAFCLSLIFRLHWHKLKKILCISLKLLQQVMQSHFWSIAHSSCGHLSHAQTLNQNCMYPFRWDVHGTSKHTLNILSIINWSMI